MRSMTPLERAVIATHACYFFVTGLWPLVHYRSFEAVTGPKRDAWLVKTLGALILPVALVGASAVRRNQASREVYLVVAGSSLALGSSSFWYGLRGRISRIYLADAVVEALLLAGLIVGRRGQRRRSADRRD